VISSLLSQSYFWWAFLSHLMKMKTSESSFGCLREASALLMTKISRFPQLSTLNDHSLTRRGYSCCYRNFLRRHS